MDITSTVTIGTIISLTIGAGVIFYHYKKRNLEKFFTQTHEMAKQVPKQKKNSFVLLMFKESLSASKNKKAKNSLSSRLNNPKYLNIQLIQMSNILKNRSKVNDKKMKKALNLLNNYQTWEAAKLAKDRQAVQNKAS